MYTHTHTHTTVCHVTHDFLGQRDFPSSCKPTPHNAYQAYKRSVDLDPSLTQALTLSLDCTTRTSTTLRLAWTWGLFWLYYFTDFINLNQEHFIFL